MSRRPVVVTVTLSVLTFGVALYAGYPRWPKHAEPLTTTNRASGSPGFYRAHPAAKNGKEPARPSGAALGGSNWRHHRYDDLRRRFRASTAMAYGPADARGLARLAQSIRLQLRNPSLWPVVKDVIYGNTAALRNALNEGLSPNVVVEKGRGNVESLLDMSIDAGQRGSIRALVDHGAAVNLDQYSLGKYGARDTYYEAPLVDAASEGADDVVEYLLHHGAYIDQNDNEVLHTDTALAAAALGGNVSTVYLLLSKGANVATALDQNGDVPQYLRRAESKPQYAAIVALLVTHGALLPPGD